MKEFFIGMMIVTGLFYVLFSCVLGWVDFFISRGIVQCPYIEWLKQRNLFGKISIMPFIIFTLPKFISGFIPSIIFQFCKLLFYIGLKGEE